MKHLLALACAMPVIAYVSLSHATRPGPDGYFETGKFTKTGPNGPVYTVVHEVKELPKDRTPQGLVQADVEKRFLIVPTRDMACDAFTRPLVAGLTRNGMALSAAQGLSRACTGATIRARDRIVLFYSPTTKTTRLEIERMGTTSVTGTAAMKHVWSVWFASADDPKGPKGLSARR